MDREEAFTLYAEQPRPRNLRRFAEETGLKHNTLRDWQRKGGWADRLARLDDERDGKLVTATVTLEGQQARFLQQAQEMQEAGSQLLAEGNPQGGLLIQRGVKLEQEALAGTLGGATGDTWEAYVQAVRQHISPLRKQFEARAEAETDDHVATAWREAGRTLNRAMADFADELNTINGYSG